MNKHYLYLSLYQALTIESCDAAIAHVEDFDRDLSVALLYNSSERLSSVTLEFAGVKSRFLINLAFDGSGPQGIGLGGITLPHMPGARSKQKAFALLACIDFLIAEGYLRGADREFMAEKISAEYSQGSVAFLHQYDKLVTKAVHHATMTKVDQAGLAGQPRVSVF